MTIHSRDIVTRPAATEAIIDLLSAAAKPASDPTSSPGKNATAAEPAKAGAIPPGARPHPQCHRLRARGGG